MKDDSQTDRPTGPPSPKGGYRHGDRATIPEEALSFREKKVLGILRQAYTPLTVRQLANKSFPGVRAKPGTYETKTADGETLRHASGAAYRAVLNSLRRLVVGGFVLKVGRGTYAPTTAAEDLTPTESDGAAPAR